MTSFYTSVERSGNLILWRGYENGRKFSRKVEYKPKLFVNSRDKTEYRSLIGNRPIEPKLFDNMSEAKDFVERYKEVSNFPIYGNTNFVQQFIQEKYPNDIEFDMNQINIFSFDIEVDISERLPNMETADNEITSIAIKSSKTDTYHLLGRKGYDKTKTLSGIDPENIQFMEFDNEKDLLRRFIQIWTNDFPDIVTGWNVVYFDIYYLVTRIMRLFGEQKAKELSPWGYIKKVTTEIFNRNQSTYNISGVNVIDYMDAFKKFGYKYGTQESYKLDHIAHVVLGKKKLDYSEYGSLTELYKQNPQLYLDYNLIDTQLIQLMEDESALLALVLTVAYGGGVNYSDAFGTVGIWESILYRKLMTKKIVPPVKSSPGEKLGELVGGYVKDPSVGLKEWIVSFDLNSLYPHLMLQYNMSPETYLQDQREYVSQEMVLKDEYQNTNPEYSVCANGVCFTNKKLGIIPEIIDEYYTNRKKVKQEMLRIEQLEQDTSDSAKKKAYKKQITQLHNSQMAIKIAMNSLYGATANRYFLYYIAEMAEAITTSGQLSIRYSQKSINEYMNNILKTDSIDYVSYVDTDSNYVNMAPLIEKVFGTTKITREQGEKFLDAVSKEKLEPAIQDGYEKLAKIMGAYRNAMSMKREKITDKTIFIAKKRYIMNVLNSEGVHYTKPKISVTGVESVRSSTPEVCRNKMEDAFKVFLNGTESDAQDFIESFRKEFSALPPAEVAKTSGTDDIGKFTDSKGWYTKGCPIHVRGAILYNKFLIDKGLNNKYETIRSGDKVKFVYLKTPNPVRENVISFPGYLPKELNLDQYVDYDTQFDKVFLKPLDIVLESMGWSATKVNSLEDFFG
jgi:DNA polymerase elongation subunit (family B)